MNSTGEASSPSGGVGRSSGTALIVTIDGPAGTGKSTVARQVAARLGLDVLDTGAMYRAVTLACVRDAVDVADEAAVLAAFDRHSIDVDTTSSPLRTLLDGDDPGEALRSREVEAVVSIIAAHPRVRGRLVELQRAVARRHPRLVTEGRDQGSVVFPRADARFFLVASARVRAARRVAQIRASGEEVDDEAVLEGIESRDRIDGSRRDGPLVRPDGAIVVDTDGLSLDEVVLEVVARVREQRERRPDDREGEAG